MIWFILIVFYLAFLVWYLGIDVRTLKPKRIQPDEADALMQRLRDQAEEAAAKAQPSNTPTGDEQTSNEQTTGPNEQLLNVIESLIRDDDGKGFLMVNLLALNTPKRDAIRTLDLYGKPFMRELLKRAGHPVLFSKVLARAVEYWGLPNGCERWDAVAIVRYRSRRDLVEMALWHEFLSLHQHKTTALKKTIAIPLSPRFFTGGIPLLAGLAVFCIGAVIA